MTRREFNLYSEILWGARIVDMEWALDTQIFKDFYKKLLLL